MDAISPTRKAANEGLLYAAHLVGYFGWEPPSADTNLHLGVAFNLAAGKAAVEAGLPVYDVEALMGYLVTEHLQQLAQADWHGLTDWECQPGRTTEDVIAALKGAS